MHFDGIIDDGLDKSLALLSNFSAIFSKIPLLTSHFKTFKAKKRECLAAGTCVRSH